MEYHLGKNRPVVDSRTLLFSSYLRAGLAAPPPSVDYGDKVSSWPMYSNSTYGDCTAAAAGHMIEAWTASASSEVTVPEAAVLTFYEHFVGDPPPPDAGCDMLSVLKYWRSSGLSGHKIDAFASVNLSDAEEARQAIDLLGGLYIGLALPDFAVEGDMLTVPWTVPPGGAVGSAAPNPGNGHCVPAVGYDAENLTVVTWGELKEMSWSFYEEYSDEAYAIVSPDFLSSLGDTPGGLDLAALTADLRQLSADRDG